MNNKYRHYAAPTLRIGISLVFLWFGLTNIFNPEMLLGYLPGFVYTLPIQATTFMIINGIVETLLAVLMLTGLFTRMSALLYGLHVLSIVFGVGYHDVAIRDFGLAVAAFAIFLYGPDQWTLDNKWRKVI